MRKQLTTSIDEELTMLVKIEAVKRRIYYNDMLEIIIRDWLKAQGIKEDRGLEQAQK